MIYTELTKKALKLCFKAHKKQVDKTGVPYVFHPYHIAEEMDNETAVVCALLHDAINDETDYELLKNQGFTEGILDTLKVLNHDKDVPFFDYIKAIAKNPIAKQVKISDLKHNSDLSRLGENDEATLKRVLKYKKAIKFLKEN